MSGEEPIKVLIVDDHQIVRQGLRTFLELQQDMDVVGEASDGETAVEMVRELAPDVVLMDLLMPVKDGIAATREIAHLDAGAQVIVLTSFAEDDQIFPAIEAGAVSYLLKDVTPDDLVAAVRAAHRGEPRLHPNVVRKLMDAACAARAADGAGVSVGGASGTLDGIGAGAAQARASAAELPDDLTERELDVIRLICRGRSNREIAQELWISEKTVKTHVSHILTKLGMKDRTQLAVHAIKRGLVEAEQE